jgi:hypothetical protein
VKLDRRNGGNSGLSPFVEAALNERGVICIRDQKLTEKQLKSFAATLLYALEVLFENGRALGDTQFSSPAAVYDSLPADMKRRISGLRAVHPVAGRRAKTGTGQQDQALRREQPASVHPVARTHPIVGQLHRSAPRVIRSQVAAASAADASDHRGRKRDVLRPLGCGFARHRVPGSRSKKCGAGPRADRKLHLPR